jgi:hypothetical protein
LQSLTAVARGAAILGIEKSTNKALPTMSACARSYGVPAYAPISDVAHSTNDLVMASFTKTAMAKEQLMWLIKKGDLILSNRPREVKGTFAINFTETGPRTGTVPIYEYDGGDLPDHLSNSRRGSLISSC